MSDRLEIMPLTKPPSATVRVPGSKSITNRALVLAALSGSGCELRGALHSEDTDVMVRALRELGFGVETNWATSLIRIAPNTSGQLIPASNANVYVANSGTSMRFLTAMVSAGHGKYRIDGVARMRERPIEDLLMALRALGVTAYSEADNGCPPVRINATGIRGGKVHVKGDVSSQFISGLLMASLAAADLVTIFWHGPYVSWPYVLMTVEQMRQFRANVLATFDSSFIVPASQKFGCKTYFIEPDTSAASYLFAAAAITGGSVTVLDIPLQSLQGDIRFVDVLADMGCLIERCSSAVTVQGQSLHGITVDMNDISDTVMTLAAVACFAEGPTTIRNVAHIRHKETDRLAALATELRRVGAEVDEYPDGLKITPRPLHGAEIETYNDHRMAMSMALIGLKVPGIVIKNPGWVAKTYPGFFNDLEKLR